MDELPVNTIKGALMAPFFIASLSQHGAGMSE